MLNELIEEIPAEVLEEIGDLNIDIESENCLQEVNELLKRTVLFGGKRLRPMLTFLMGNLFRIPIKKIRPYARAIELVHAASLAHDDVVDQATTRRGRPSINVVGSNKRAVLSGDYLLADVIVSLVNAGHYQLVAEMSTIIQDLALGEWIQLDRSESRAYDREAIETIAVKKTSSVMSWCCFVPAYLADAPESVIEYTRQFGIHLGLAFQLMDDTLDFSGQSQKDHQLDMANGVINAVTYEWLSSTPQGPKFYREGRPLSELLLEENLSSALDIVRERAESHLQRSFDLLDVIEKEWGQSDPAHFAKAKRPVEKILEYLGRRDY